MPTTRNNVPFSFRSFQGKQPTPEEVRSELEKVARYLQSLLASLQFSEIGGTIADTQIPSVITSLASITTDYQAADAAMATQIAELLALINDPVTGILVRLANLTTVQSAVNAQLTDLATRVHDLENP